MKINELKLVYFSPNGTTRRVVMETARNMDMKSVSFDLSVYKEKKPTLKFAENDAVLFAVPVYGGRVPALFTEYMKQISGLGTPAALIVTYGCREYDDALLELSDIAKAQGFRIIGAAAFPTEHCMLPEIGARRPNKSDMKIAAEYGTELNRRLKKADTFSNISIEIPGQSPYCKYQKASIVPKVDISRCTECGTCAKVCSAGAISFSDPKKTDSKKCISCMKCIRICRQNARYVGAIKASVVAQMLRKKCDPTKQAELFL